MSADLDDTFGFDALQDELVTDEGRRNQAYIDTMGLTTIGIGRELSRKGLSDNEVNLLFRNDVIACCEIMDRNISWWRTLPPAKQRVMLNLCFMGWGSFSQFHKFLAAMEAHDWATAAAELQDSKWWTQVASRGPRVKARLLAPSPIA